MRKSIRGYEALLNCMLALVVSTWIPEAIGPVNAQSLPAPAMTGPLQTGSPTAFNAGPFGKLSVTGVVSGFGLWQGNPIPGDEPTQADLSNGQLFIQKTTGWWQFYLQAGAYNIPALGNPFLSTGETISQLYGPLPVGYLKVTPAKGFSILLGAMPAVLGDEYTFTFENMNIERGLLWSQTNSINRGVELNGNFGKVTALLSWNDGYYSNRYTWLMGSLTYAINSANSLTFIGGGNLGKAALPTPTTPMQNNGSLYDLIYTYIKGPWTIQPYVQYNLVPANQDMAIKRGAAARGAAVLVNYNFKRDLSLAARGEYISTTGSASEGSANLLYGPGSGGWSLTLTPTFQHHGFFMRGDFSIVQATNLTPGEGFGPLGLDRMQPRSGIEVGFMF
jgi:hypothetical protein